VVIYYDSYENLVVWRHGQSTESLDRPSPIPDNLSAFYLASQLPSLILEKKQKRIEKKKKL